MEMKTTASSASNTDSDTDQVLKPQNKYRLTKIIGKGTYSTVYMSQICDDADQSPEDDVVSEISEVLQDFAEIDLNATPQGQPGKDGKQVEYAALKIIQKPNFQKWDSTYMEQKEIFMNDATVLERIQGHRNIVKLIEVIPEGVVQTVDNQSLHVDYAMVIECLHGGELSFNMRKFGRYSPAIAHYFFVEVVDAITHMHERGFCHRDLKPWNIMLSKELDCIKVIDFSYSTPLNSSEFERCPSKIKSFLSGTRQFMAPEQLDEHSFPMTDDFSKIDVWAIAVLLTNMLTLDFAFANLTTDY